jgi:hypothetical protein
MRRPLALLVGIGGLCTSCFSDDAALGLPCTTSKSCGKEQLCIDGRCQREYDEPRYCPDIDGVVRLDSDFPVEAQFVQPILLDEPATNCGTGAGAQALYQWTAPFAGSFTVQTRTAVPTASALDETVSSVGILLGGCTGELVACQTPEGGLRTFSAKRDETVIIAVDGLPEDPALASDVTVRITDPEHCLVDDAEIASVVPVVVSGSTRGRTDELHSDRCDLAPTGDGPDAGFVWTAPAKGDYVLEVQANFPAALYVNTTDCGGLQQGCSRSFAGSDSPSLSVSLDRNDEIVVVVDGVESADAGEFMLSIDDAFWCVDARDRLGLEFPREGLRSNAAFAEPLPTASCAPDGSMGLTFQWTAPATGLWRFGTSASTTNVSLSVLDSSCSGVPLACAGPGSAAVVPLSLGESVVLVAAVEEPAGVVAIDLEPVACDSRYIEGDLPLSVSDLAMPRASSVSGIGCRDRSAPVGDTTLSWTPPRPGLYRFEVTAPDFVPVVSVLAGACAGERLECTDEGGAVEVELDARPVTIAVGAPAGSAGGPFELQIIPATE